MNFLWHNQLAKEICGQLQSERANEFCFGSIAPDFAAMGLGRTIRVKESDARGALSAELQAVQRGIDFHYYIDPRYDKLSELDEIRSRLRDKVFAGKVSGETFLSRILTVLAPDLLLDGYMQRGSEPHNDLKTSLDIANRIDISAVSSNPKGMYQAIANFHERIPNYDDPATVAHIIGSISLRRLGRDLSNEELHTTHYVVETFQPLVYEIAPRVIESIRRVAADFPLVP